MQRTRRPIDYSLKTLRLCWSDSPESRIFIFDLFLWLEAKLASELLSQLKSSLFGIHVFKHL